MATGPKDLTSKFFPGLEDQHVVGAAGLGYTAIDTTIAATTVKTNAQLVAAPPNTSGLSYGPVVHSLRIAPSFAFAQLNGANGAGMGQSVSFEYVTADISAVYLRPTCFTLAGANVGVRVIVVR